MSKILLVDDDIELVGMLREYLEQEGFQVAVAHGSGGEAHSAGVAPPGGA